MNLFLRLLKFRRSILVFALLLACLSAGYAWQHGRINSDLGSLIKPSESLRWFSDNEQFKRQFPQFEQTALVVVSGESFLSVSRQAKKLVKRLAMDERFSEVFAPGVSEFVVDRRWYFLSEDELGQWLRGVEYGYGPMLRLADEASVSNVLFTLGDHLRANRGQPLPTVLASAVDSLASGPMAVSVAPLLVDPDRQLHFEIIVVRGRQDLGAELPNQAIVAALRQHVTDFNAPRDVQVRLSGEVVLAHEEIQAAFNGIELAGLVSIVLLAIILGAGIRSARFVLGIFLLLAVGVSLTLGLAVFFVGSFNTLSLIFVVMFFGLGVDFAVHFGLRLREASFDLGPEAGLRVALLDIGPALILCMVTSSIAFLSFTPTAYVGLGELGIISALGMVVAFVLSTTLLPVLLGNSSAAMPRIHLDLSSNRPGITVSFFVAAAVVAGWTAKDLEFDYSVLAMRDSNSEGMQTLLALQDSGVATDYSIATLTNSRTETAQLRSDLLELDVVGGVFGIEELIPEAQANKFKLAQVEAERYEQIADVLPAETSDLETLTLAMEYLTETLVHATLEVKESIQSLIAHLQRYDEAQLAGTNQRLHRELTSVLLDHKRALRTEPFTMADVPEALVNRFVSEDGQYLLRVQPKTDLSDRSATTAFIEGVSAVAPNIAGRSVVEWGIGNVVVASFLKASSIALMGIFLVLVFFFRGILLPVLVLTPISLTLLFTFAICQLTGLTLNMANILVVPLIIGLGVDTGIHVVHRLTQVGPASLGASSTARAVVISALTTIGTFFSLSFSPHLGAASIGLLLTVAISLLVVVTFVLLPALLRMAGLDTAASNNSQ